MQSVGKAEEGRDVTGVRPDHTGHCRPGAVNTHVLGICGGSGGRGTASPLVQRGRGSWTSWRGAREN